METEIEDLRLSKKGKREVSTFLSLELIFEYAMGTLDLERQQAVERTLSNSKDLQSELKKIRLAIEYTDRLSKTQFNNTVIQEINSPETYLSILLKKSNFEKWPVGLKWGLESLIVVAGLVVILTIAPWEKALRWGMSPNGKEVILAEVTRDQKIGDPLKLKEIEKSEPAQFSDELPKKAEVAVQNNSGTTGATLAETKALPSGSTNEFKPDIGTAKPGVVAKVGEASGAGSNVKVGRATTIAAQNAGPIKADQLPVGKVIKLETTKPSNNSALVQGKSEASDKAEARGGFLYRGQMSITNLPVAGPKISEKIIEIGGRKAGDVELGWQKSPTSLYYHFTIPEAKYDELMAFLAQYGKPKLVKEKHPRVMPDGIIRLILTTDESKK